MKSLLKFGKSLFSRQCLLSQKMIRMDKALPEEDIISIVGEANILRLGLFDEENELPYISPMNYGFDIETSVIYMHSSSNPKGRRMRILQDNPVCCFEIDVGGNPIVSENPCDSTCEYRSVIGYGRVEFLLEVEEKMEGLKHIMMQCAPESMRDVEWEFPKKAAENTCVMKLEIDSWTGKQSPPPEQGGDDL